MSRVERRQLIRLGRRSDDPYTALRFQAVARLGTGTSTPQVAAALEIATSTVIGAADRFLADGVAGLYDRRRGNGARKADERFDRVVVRLLGCTPQDFGWQRPTWTRELLCLQMKLEGFPAVAVCTMGRALSRVGARLGTPKPIVLCPWPRDRRLRVLAAIRRLEARASAKEPVLYSDEVDIHLNPKIGRDWMLRGHQRRIVTPGKNQKFYLAGALDVRTGRLHTTGAASKNAALFCQLLWLLASRYRRARCVHLIVDNYAIHKARLTRKTLTALGGRIVLHFLPPYCPDSNRIERVWQDFHANVTRNHRCKTLNRLLDNARLYLDAYRWKRTAAKRAVARVA
ncbi:MAG: IS630 family transposase [Polyangiaceae bacterium]|jgi:transposase